jgi:uncharacterized membrane protein YphA (DoxX/SURF4 family)
MMNIALWIVTVVLALMFGMAGFAKLTQPYEKLTARMAWASDFSPRIVRAIGLIELLGGLGLILPAVTGILPVLVPLAAAGLALDMLGAVVTHVRRKEPTFIAATLVLAALAAFIALGRFVIVPL